MRVLLADDHKEIRLLTAHQLQRSGHYVVAVCDGEQALSAFKREPFDVVLLDEQMPIVDGVQVVHVIRLLEKNSTSSVPVIALTGNCSESDRVRLLSAGFDAVIGKPFRLDALSAMLDHIAEHSLAPIQSLSPAPPHFDSADLIKRLAGGDDSLFRQVIATFLRDVPKRLLAIEKAIEQKHADALASAAHALKGSVAMFGAEQARQLCAQLQECGRSNTLEGASDLFVQLNEYIAELQANLRGYAGQTGSDRARTNIKTERSRLDSKRKTP